MSLVMRAPLAYIIRKTIIVQIYGDYPKYATPNDEMIVRMLHLPKTKISYTMNKVHSQSHSIKHSMR